MFEVARLRTMFNKLEKEDWCSEQGGKWITSKGRHICITEDYEFSRGKEDWMASSIIHGKNKATLMRWKKGSITDEQALEIKTNIQYYPKDIRESVNRVEITDGFLDSGVTGINYGVGKMGRKSNIYLSTKEDLVGTLHHEIGHGVYNNYVKVADARESRWSDIHKAKIAPSWYGTTSSEEDFAESLSLYKTDKKTLANEFPDRHEFIENVLEGVEDES